MKKNINNNLFDTLNWILKKEKKQPFFILESNFILNRWLSMVNPEIAQIINITGNRWNKNITKFSMAKFYKSILPKNSDQIFYIKKKREEKEIENIKEMTNYFEMSQKELIFLEKALEDLNIDSK